MMPAVWAIEYNQLCDGCLSTNSTVFSSTARIDSIGAICDLSTGSTAGSVMMRSIEAMTASAVTWEPLANRACGRNSKV